MTPPAGPALENRLPDEGINISAEHPLKEFLWLIGVALVGLALLLGAMAWVSGWLAPKLPFAYEVSLARRVIDRPVRAEEEARRVALQALADRVAAHMDLPAGMTPVMGVDPTEAVNAYATLGGRITVFDGLLRRISSEEALAALLAHEIAHVKHRHVAANMGRGLSTAVLLGVLSVDAGAQVAQRALSGAAGLALLTYSRQQETDADAEALAALHAMYGHVGGFFTLFEALEASNQTEPAALEILASHPLTPHRLAGARARAQTQGWSTSGPASPLAPPLVIASSRAASSAPKR